MTSKLSAEELEGLKYKAFQGDDEVCLVLADRLLEQDDPRGEFYVLNYELQNNAHKLSPEEKSNYQQEWKRVLQQLFKIEDLDDRFRLYNVPYRREFYVVDWNKKLLDNGNKHTQDEWINLLKDINSEWQLPSGLVYHASLAALHYNRDNPDEEQRDLVAQCREMHALDFKNNWMMTSTRITYHPEGKDTIIHDYGSAQQQELDLNFISIDNYVNAYFRSKQKMSALFGTIDCGEIETIYHLLSGKKPRLSGLQYRPQHKRSNYLVLGTGGISNSFDIDTDGFFNIERGHGIIVKPVN